MDAYKNPFFKANPVKCAQIQKKSAQNDDFFMRIS